MKKNRDKTQLLRLIFIDQKIREGMRTGVLANCSTIAAEYEVSTKSILRDIDYLKNMKDAPIEYDAARKGYFYTEENFKLPAVEINASDLFALCIAEKVLKEHEDTPVYGKLVSVFKKIEDSLPETVSIHPSWADLRISVISSQKTKIFPEIWSTIAQALSANQSIKIGYKGPGKSTAVKRLVDPYHIVNYQGEWYLIGYCHLRKKILTFAISRILTTEVTSSQYSIPKDFDYTKLSQNRFGIFSGSKSYEIQICFDKEIAPFIEERQWHPDQKIQITAEGRLILSFPATHTLEVKKWVLSWGKSAEVIKPQFLRDEIIDELQEMLTIYK